MCSVFCSILRIRCKRAERFLSLMHIQGVFLMRQANSPILDLGNSDRTLAEHDYACTKELVHLALCVLKTFCHFLLSPRYGCLPDVFLSRPENSQSQILHLRVSLVFGLLTKNLNKKKFSNKRLNVYTSISGCFPVRARKFSLRFFGQGSYCGFSASVITNLDAKDLSKERFLYHLRKEMSYLQLDQK